jgi:hypothetical protein
MAAGAAGQSGCARLGTAGAALARSAASRVACRVGSGRREGRLLAHLTGAGLPADGATCQLARSVGAVGAVIGS